MAPDGTLLVTLAGTDPNHFGYDTNVMNALETGLLNPDDPYVQDVKLAIDEYIAEHGLSNPKIVIAGYSLGGMVAQLVAQDKHYNVTNIVTYGSPTMGDPVPGVKYTMYVDRYDPVPLLSRYENPNMPDNLAWGLGLLGTFGLPYIPYLLTPIVNEELGSWQNKLATMDPHNLYNKNGNSIQLVPDVGKDLPPLTNPLFPHQQYIVSAWLKKQTPDALKEFTTLSNTEYFGMPDNNPVPLS